MGEYWNGRARENFIGVACWNHSPEEADRKGQREAAYLAGLMAASPLGRAGGKLTVLDIGGGYGRIAKHLAPRAGRYILLDASGEMLLKASEHLAGLGVELALGDGFNLSGVDDDSVDFAFACMCFQHLDHEVTIHYLQELRRVLKRNAWAWFHVPPVKYPERFSPLHWRDWPGNLHQWAADQMAEVCLRVGLSVIEMRFDEDPLEVLVQRPAQSPLLRWMVARS